MEVKPLQKENESAWNNFVNSSHNSTFFHTTAWKKAVESSYGHKSIYLIAEDKTIQGILPLFIINNKIVSVPFGDYGGICTSTQEASKLLLEKAKEICREKDASYIELRQTKKIESLTEKNCYNSLVLKLNNIDLMWKGFSKKIRNAVRKAEKFDLQITIGNSSKDIDSFYAVYSQNMRDLGSPSHKKEFFANIIRFYSNCTIMTTKFKEKIIGGIFMIKFKNTISVPWASSLRGYFRMNPNNLLYWEAIKYAVNNNFKYFDFLRSRIGSSNFDFKKRWGAMPKQLYYSYYLNNIKQIPDQDPHNPKYTIAIAVWKKMPFFLANKIGPLIRRNIP
jgi:FemAB-related protein (PEP-CTERM system-associated)